MWFSKKCKNLIQTFFFYIVILNIVCKQNLKQKITSNVNSWSFFSNFNVCLVLMPWKYFSINPTIVHCIYDNWARQWIYNIYFNKPTYLCEYDFHFKHLWFSLSIESLEHNIRIHLKNIAFDVFVSCWFLLKETKLCRCYNIFNISVYIE